MMVCGFCLLVNSHLNSLIGALKFNALLEWLQSHLDGTFTSSSQRKKSSTSQAAEVTGNPVDDAALRRAKQQAKLDEAERRDQARRAKLGQKLQTKAVADDGDDQTGKEELDEPSKVQEAPAPEPEKTLEDVEPVEETLVEEAQSEAADPEPEGDTDSAIQEETGSAKPVVVHEEL
jgi:protein disulfide-isomerase A6